MFTLIHQNKRENATRNDSKNLQKLVELDCVLSSRRQTQLHFYHYTTFERLNEIRSSGVLIPATPTFRLNLGHGVYITDCSPRSNTDQLRYQLFRYGTKQDHKLHAFVRMKKKDILQRYSDIKQYSDGRRSFRINTNNRPIQLKRIQHNFGIWKQIPRSLQSGRKVDLKVN
ncbi:uncharacterized protein LOC142344367 isoform X2 [Convolutriloba macropyga]|uniref:uncharacterized protein LOC142344367 isoform X2 n=1 Tax=Convolutriloba macropyga TaxID=536237 RepID=UPI003F5218B1